jgi:hypothetical protein
MLTTRPLGGEPGISTRYPPGSETPAKFRAITAVAPLSRSPTWIAIFLRTSRNVMPRNIAKRYVSQTHPEEHCEAMRLAATQEIAAILRDAARSARRDKGEAMRGDEAFAGGTKGIGLAVARAEAELQLSN